MEDHDSAGSPGHEHAPEPPAHTHFDARESSAPSHAAPESGSSEKSAGSGPSDRPRGERGGYGRFRDRGGRGRGGRGRRPAPRRSGGEAGGYDRPPREESRDYPPDSSRESHEEDAPKRLESDEIADEPGRSYDDASDSEPVAEAADSMPEGEGSSTAESDPVSGRADYPDDRGEPAEEAPRRREPDRGRERGRDSYERRERPERRERRDDRFERDRSPYRTLRGQVDRIRHTLETVVRDLERVLTTLSQAEHEQQLTDQEIESLRTQIDQLQRGGGGRSFDRGHRRHDDSERD